MLDDLNLDESDLTPIREARKIMVDALEIGPELQGFMEESLIPSKAANHMTDLLLGEPRNPLDPDEQHSALSGVLMREVEADMESAIVDAILVVGSRHGLIHAGPMDD